MASIRERTSKGGETTWSVLFRHHGKQTSETFATAKKAERFKVLVEALGPDKALAELNGAQVSGLTLTDLAERFFDFKSSPAQGLTPRTVADYRRDFANWIEPHLGDRQADSIDELDVQQLVDHMATRLDPKTVAGHHVLLGSIYRWGSARTRRMVDHNPCLETELPKRKKKPVKGITIPEWQSLYSLAQATDPPLADFMLFLVTTGWRWSEAAALMWRDVEDYEDGVFVSVAQVVRRSPGATGAIVQDAKNTTSLRRTRVSRETAEMLRRRRVGQPLDGFVLTSGTGTRWHQSNFRSRHWVPLLEAAGFTGERRPTPHWLRHTHMALLDRAGVSMPKISRRLGHSNISTTVNVYGGMIEDVDGGTLDKVDAMLSPAMPAVSAVVAGEMA